ncbi:MAG: competence/damage-inducible protein A [Dehalococcoidia bacterium]
MKAEIFSIGTELLMGELVDTNGSWIASHLPALGIEVQGISLIGDNLDMLSEAFAWGLQRSDFIFTTGGLGPTADDLTREAIAKALGETPTVQEEALAELKENFRRRGTEMPAHNIKQAHLIPSAQFVPNPNGTAPGWWVERDGRVIVCMPGPPGETHPMWENAVAPRLRELVDDEVTITRNIKTLGMSEAAIDEIVSEFFGHDNPYLGIYSKADGIHLRVIARARDEATGRQMIAPIEDAITERLGPYIWGYDDETPDQAVGLALMERGLTLASMESCTGGFLANSITEVLNSATYYKGGMVATNREMQLAGGVPPSVLDQHGSVSQEAATAMARAAREKLNADYGIGIAGVGGPEDQEGQPPGQVYIAIAGANRQLRELAMRLPRRRLTIKRRASNTALTELRRMIAEG